MTWREGIPITEQVYFTLKPVLIISRVLGVFPAVLVKKGTKLYLKWSPIYILYSCFLGILIPILTYRGLLLDIMREKKLSIKIKSNTDMYVAVCDITVLIFAIDCGIFSNVLGYSKFSKFIECLHKVDIVAPPNQTSSRTRSSTIFMIIVILTATFSITTADLIMYFIISDEQVSDSFICECYLGFYSTYYIMLVNQYKFCHLGYYVLRRTQQINQHLETDNFKRINPYGNIEDRLHNKINVQNKRIGYIIDTITINQRVLKSKNVNSRNNHIFELMRAYERLCDAVDILTELYGLTNAVTIIGILWHLIETPYLLITEINGERKDVMYITVLSSWCFLHIFRLMLIAQPCYGCLYEVQRTNDLIAKLLFSQNTDVQFKSQLHDFSLMLLHRKFEFTASGLTQIDRSLMISVLGAVTTYLVILLQFAQSEKS